MAPAASTLPASLDVDVSNYSNRIDQYYTKVESLKDSIAAKPVTVDQSTLPHSGPQGQVKPLTIIDDPADWKAADWAGKESEYTYVFTPQDIAELTAAVSALKARGVQTEDDVLALTKADFPLPTLAPKLLELYAEVNHGRGFQLFKGFPVEQYKNDRLGLVLAFWALALTVGRVQVSQTDYDVEGKVFGSVLNHVTGGRHAQVFKGKGYGDKLNSKRLVFHSDQAATDLISLLSIGAAPEGGLSKWVSGVAIHNELIRRGRTDLVAELSKLNSWIVPQKADQATFKRKADGSFEAFEDSPPFEYHDGYLSVHYASGNYQEVQLSPLQEEAIWTFAALAESPEFYLEKKLQPGEIEWIHNATILHSRTDIFEGETPEEKRHLIRWWVQGDKSTRPVASHYAPRGSVQPEGGFRIPEGSKIRLPFFPYSRHDGQGISAPSKP